MATGQPSSGKSEYGELAHCLLGATNETPRDFAGVARRTIWNWVATPLDFADAVRCGRRAGFLRNTARSTLTGH
jgi:hypothetical protein